MNPTDYVALIEKSMLLEFPWVKYGNDKHFDLDAERLAKEPSRSELLADKIRRILAGEQMTDSKGTPIYITDPAEAQSFLDAVKREPILDAWGIDPDTFQVT